MYKQHSLSLSHQLPRCPSQAKNPKPVKSWKFELSYFKFGISNFIFQILYFNFHISYFMFHISYFKFHISNFIFQISYFKYHSHRSFVYLDVAPSCAYHELIRNQWLHLTYQESNFKFHISNFIIHISNIIS